VKRTFKKSKAGLTLVEVVIAMMVVAVGIGGTIQVASMANKMTRSTANQMQAVHMARQQLETMRQNSFSDSALSLGSHSVTDGITYVVSRYATGSTATNSKVIVMNVPWTNAFLKTTVTASVTTVFVDAVH
jgi:type IV pilus assembly protein PilV